MSTLRDGVERQGEKRRLRARVKPPAATVEKIAVLPRGRHVAALTLRFGLHSRGAFRLRLEGGLQAGGAPAAKDRVVILGLDGVCSPLALFCGRGPAPLTTICRRSGYL